MAAPNSRVMLQYWSSAVSALRPEESQPAPKVLTAIPLPPEPILMLTQSLVVFDT